MMMKDCTMDARIDAGSEDIIDLPTRKQLRVSGFYLFFSKSPYHIFVAIN